MLDFSSPGRIIVTCSKRLAPFVAQEISDLSYKTVRTFPTGVELNGTINDCIRLNLNLRCASQVHYSLKTFTAEHPDDVYKTLLDYPWETILTRDSYFSVTSNVDHPTVNNNLFVNVRVKDAIVDRMTRLTGKRPDSGSELRGAVFYIFWRGPEAEIFLDTSGETLTKHGYRKIPGKAPMLESLATATLLATTWDRNSNFINPMCGSGTVIIEAALLATNRRPGLLRSNYSFMHVTGYDDHIYQTALQELRDGVRTADGIRFIATDISKNAIEISMANANYAGVRDMIEFHQCDFSETEIPEGGGTVYFNPEYGERLGELRELEDTYSRMGDFLKKKCQGCKGYIFTGNLELAKKIGLKASRRIEFYTARLDCRLFEYELYSGTRRKD